MQAVGTSADGALDVPEDIRVAGWWRGGARLGDPFGSMLIAAHVDSRTQGLGPYVALLSVEPGARFEVTGRRDLDPDLRGLRAPGGGAGQALDRCPTSSPRAVRRG